MYIYREEQSLHLLVFFFNQTLVLSWFFFEAKVSIAQLSVKRARYQY